MFYLIGGAPRSGKTTLAKELSKKTGLPWISTDTLESVVMEYVPDEKFDEMFPKNQMRRITHNSNEEMYSEYSAEEICSAYLRQGISIYSAIKSFIESENNDSHGYIIEGHHIHPSLIKELASEYDIKAIFLGREDEKDFLASTIEHASDKDWVTRKSKDEAIYPTIVRMLILFSMHIRKEAGEYDLPYFTTDNDLPQKVREIIDQVARERRG